MLVRDVDHRPLGRHLIDHVLVVLRPFHAEAADHRLRLIVDQRQRFVRGDAHIAILIVQQPAQRLAAAQTVGQVRQRVGDAAAHGRVLVPAEVGQVLAGALVFQCRAGFQARQAQLEVVTGVLLAQHGANGLAERAPGEDDGARVVGVPLERFDEPAGLLLLEARAALNVEVRDQVDQLAGVVGEPAGDAQADDGVGLGGGGLHAFARPGGEAFVDAVGDGAAAGPARLIEDQLDAPALRRLAAGDDQGVAHGQLFGLGGGHIGGLGGGVALLLGLERVEVDRAAGLGDGRGILHGPVRALDGQLGGPQPAAGEARGLGLGQGLDEHVEPRAVDRAGGDQAIDGDDGGVGVGQDAFGAHLLGVEPGGAEAHLLGIVDHVLAQERRHAGGAGAVEVDDQAVAGHELGLIVADAAERADGAAEVLGPGVGDGGGPAAGLARGGFAAGDGDGEQHRAGQPGREGGGESRPGLTSGQRGVGHAEPVD